MHRDELFLRILEESTKNASRRFSFACRFRGPSTRVILPTYWNAENLGPHGDFYFTRQNLLEARDRDGGDTCLDSDEEETCEAHHVFMCAETNCFLCSEPGKDMGDVPSEESDQEWIGGLGFYSPKPVMSAGECKMTLFECLDLDSPDEDLFHCLGLESPREDFEPTPLLSCSRTKNSVDVMRMPRLPYPRWYRLQGMRPLLEPENEAKSTFVKVYFA